MKPWIVAALLFIQSGCSMAAVVPNLYDIALPSVTQSETEKQKLLKEGLRRVLERVSGESTICHQNTVKRALENAMDYVEQYTYQNNMLNVKYSADLVNSLIYQTGQIVWGPRRPNVVVWLVIEENQKKRLVGAETDPQMQSLLMQLAQEKGVPLILPLMDLQDMSAVTVKDVWEHYHHVLQPASDRYSAQSILVGRIIHQDKGWKSHWDLLSDNESSSWQFEGQNLEEILTQGISGTARHLVNRYGAKAARTSVQQSKPVLISIEDIQTASDFNKVEDYLRSLSEVIDVSVSQVLGSTAIFEVTTQDENARQALERALNVDHHLMATGMPINIANVELSYRWIPPRSRSQSGEEQINVLPLVNERSKTENVGIEPMMEDND